MAALVCVSSAAAARRPPAGGQQQQQRAAGGEARAGSSRRITTTTRVSPPPARRPAHLPQEKDEESNKKTYFVTFTSPRPAWEIHQKNNRHPRTCRRYMLMPNLNVQKTQQQSNLSAFYVNERPNNKPVRLFLRTTRCLEAHEELKMWYGMCFLLLLYYCILISLLNRSVLLL